MNHRQICRHDLGPEFTFWRGLAVAAAVAVLIWVTIAWLVL